MSYIGPSGAGWRVATHQKLQAHNKSTAPLPSRNRILARPLQRKAKPKLRAFIKKSGTWLLVGVCGSQAGRTSDRICSGRGKSFGLFHWCTCSSVAQQRSEQSNSG